jgi:hypothetical protein
MRRVWLVSARARKCEQLTVPARNVFPVEIFGVLRTEFQELKQPLEALQRS